MIPTNIMMEVQKKTQLKITQLRIIELTDSIYVPDKKILTKNCVCWNFSPKFRKISASKENLGDWLTSKTPTQTKIANATTETGLRRQQLSSHTEQNTNEEPQGGFVQQGLSCKLLNAYERTNPYQSDAVCFASSLVHTTGI